MGIVWEAYHKGVPLLGVPENPTEHGIPTVQLKLGESGESISIYHNAVNTKIKLICGYKSIIQR